MKNKFLIGIFALLFVGFLATRLCSPDTVTEKITVESPEIKGEFAPEIEVVHQVLPKPTVISKNHTELKKRISDYEKEIESLRTAFLEKDCEQKIEVFDEINQLRGFNSTFEDDHLLLNISGVVQGYVHEITPNYTIKTQTIEAPVNLPKLKTKTIHAFGSLGANRDVSHTLYGAGVAYTSDKSFYTVQVQKINNVDYASVSVGIPLLRW